MLALASIPFLPDPVGNSVLLVLSFLLLLLGAEVFTNGVEWLGHRFGVSESATGSILAAVGTALPETMIPVIAIVSAMLGGSAAHANEVGVGAILGAPFMLATIASFLVGASVLYFDERRVYGREFHFDPVSTRRDLAFFLVGYTLAFVAALLPETVFVGGVAVPVALLVGTALLCLYVVYVYRSLTSGELMAGEELDDLHLGALIERGENPLPSVGFRHDHSTDPSRAVVVLQTLIALAFIVGGANLFVSEVTYFSENVLHVPTAVLALLLAPLATELPEKFNSVLWISRSKDTLAIGNITGAMAFQGTVPVTLGVVFTSWNLALEWGTVGFLNGLSAVLAIASGLILYSRVRATDGDSLDPVPFLVGGLFYLGFIVVLVYHVLFLGVSVGGH